MNAFLLYVIQSALCMSLFYGVYCLLLRREAFFRFNRSVLLSIIVFSMIVPFIRLPANESGMVHIPMQQLEEIFVTNNIGGEQAAIQNPVDDQYLATAATPAEKPAFNILPLVYLAGVLISLLAAFISIISVIRIVISARPVVYQQQRIFVSSRKISSFTFAGWIVLSEMDYERFPGEIITHEAIHRNKGHFWDLCLAGIVTVIHWFNPLGWLLRRELKTLHEYEADRNTITQGINATRYKLLLIEKAAGASRYSMASSFAQSKIKKRIIMLNKQNHHPWARWKALLFIPLAALLLQAFARPEIKRELEQISSFKSTEFIQENVNWTEEKFLEELRKCLPEGVSHDLNYDETWNAVAKSYPLNINKSNRGEGITIMMNKNGKMMANSTHVSFDDIPGLMAKNLTANKENNFFNNIVPISVDGIKVDKTIRYTSIQRDVATPADAFQKLTDAVGNAYMLKRNEISQQCYQTDYHTLEADKKTTVDKIVPIMVKFEIPKGLRTISTKETPSSVAIYSNSPDFSVKSYGDKMPTEEEWKKAEAEFEKINNRQIAYNGQIVKIKDLFELLKKDTGDKVKMNYRYRYDKNTGKSECKVAISAPAIDPKDPAYYYLENGKWVYSVGILLDLVHSIDVYNSTDAFKRYGNKAKNGAISLNCTPPPQLVRKK